MHYGKKDEIDEKIKACLWWIVRTLAKMFGDVTPFVTPKANLVSIFSSGLPVISSVCDYTQHQHHLFVCLSVSLTCSHKQDASTEQDVVLAAVYASNSDTQATQHQQDGAEDGEQARRAHYTCSKQRSSETILTLQIRTKQLPRVRDFYLCRCCSTHSLITKLELNLRFEPYGKIKLFYVQN